MKRLADGLHMLSGFPPNAINVYLMGDVLVDAGTRHSGRRIFRQLEGHTGHDPCAHARASRPPGREPRGVRAARHRAVVRRARRGRDGERQPRPEGPPAQQGDHAGLGGTAASGRAPAARGRRGRRLQGARRARPLARSRRLLAGVGPDADRRRRAEQHEHHDRHHRAARAARGVHHRPGAEPRIGAPAGRARARRSSVFGHGPPLRDTRKFVQFVESLPR